MARQRLLQISVVVLLLAAASAQASSVSISIGGRNGGVHFSASSRPAVAGNYRHARPYSGLVVAPHTTLIIPPRVVVPQRRLYVQQPVYRPAARPYIAPVTVTVWITNSNGSQLPVILTKTGLGYQGPRGEYYSTFPSNRQLRQAYGF